MANVPRTLIFLQDSRFKFRAFRVDIDEKGKSTKINVQPLVEKRDYLKNQAIELIRTQGQRQGLLNAIDLARQRADVALLGDLAQLLESPFLKNNSFAQLAKESLKKR